MRIKKTERILLDSGYRRVYQPVEDEAPVSKANSKLRHLKRGQTIQAGQQIAESGNTGRTFAPHLHYEIQSRKNKKTIYNPFTFKHHKSYTRSIPPQHQQDFQQAINRYNSVTKES